MDALSSVRGPLHKCDGGQVSKGALGKDLGWGHPWPATKQLQAIR